jgi:ethanolamine utilization protein EutN
MILARVKGNVVATMKHPCFEGHRLLIVQPIDEKGGDKGDSFLACDNVQAGPGDVVLVQREGNTARQLLGTLDDPFHSVIVGIVDKISEAV